jgi:hypothetical protein
LGNKIIKNKISSQHDEWHSEQNAVNFYWGNFCIDRNYEQVIHNVGCPKEEMSQKTNPPLIAIDKMVEEVHRISK